MDALHLSGAGMPGREATHRPCPLAPLAAPAAPEDGVKGSRRMRLRNAKRLADLTLLKKLTRVVGVTSSARRT